jgi:uncharacterized damage-inducible protein DinB
VDPFLAAARTTFRDQQEAFATVIADLPAEALDWQPATDANSLTVLVTHAWGAAEAWTLRAAGREMARDRAAEFRATGDPAALQTLLMEGGARIEAALDVVDPAMLSLVRVGPSTQPSGDEEYTAARCVLHAVEHAQEHLGQAYLTRQLWEAQHSVRQSGRRLQARD